MRSLRPLLTYLPFTYVYLTSFTSGDDKIPVKVAGGLQIGVSTGEDIVAAFGEADEVKEINTDDADLIDYYYEFDNCKYIFVTYKDSGIIETIHINMK
ncbi:hypothetical protein [Butyrivibrio sp. MC2013]|uniref:hypothetical protein n=1 Tax=Butyrivibrio sp. MC2013 TaxID=1280686 RepID=UPI00047DD6DC|nr:hypothetical protein [Butyrivibrio sp. MC2013]